jgi:Phage tail tube protein
MLRRLTAALAKIETVYGTDPIPTGAANALLLHNVQLTPIESDYANRDLIRPFLGRSEEIPVSIHAMLEFDIELAGAGAAGTVPAYGPLLRACGFSETVSAGVSVVYAPVSVGQESVTLYYNNDGRLHKLTGARGSVSLELNAKSLPYYKFKFQGLYSIPTDTAMPVTTFAAWQKPVPVNNVNTTNFSLLGFNAAVMASFSVDIANSLAFRSLVGVSEKVIITDRAPAGKITLEDTLVAAKDWWTAIKNATTGAMSVTHGAVAGNKVKIDSPAAQLTKPSLTESDGISMVSFDMNFVPGNTGNDELTITVL